MFFRNSNDESENAMKSRYAKKYDEQLIQLLLTASKNMRDQTAKLVAADWCQEHDMPNLEAFLRFMATLDPKHICSQVLFTGSRCYGNWATDESDIDWVMCVDKSTEETLYWLANEVAQAYGEVGQDASYYGCGQTTLAVRIGPLNLILIRSERQWRTWKQGTHQMRKWQENAVPVDRDIAILTFDSIYRSLPEDRLRRTPIHWDYVSRSTVEQMLEWYHDDCNHGGAARHDCPSQNLLFSEWLQINHGFNDEQARLAVCIRYELQDERPGNEKG